MGSSVGVGGCSVWQQWSNGRGEDPEKAGELTYVTYIVDPLSGDAFRTSKKITLGICGPFGDSSDM